MTAAATLWGLSGIFLGILLNAIVVWLPIRMAEEEAFWLASARGLPTSQQPPSDQPPLDQPHLDQPPSQQPPTERPPLEGSARQTSTSTSYWRILSSFNTHDWLAWFVILGTGAIAWILYARFGNTLKTIAWLIFFSFMIVLAAIDLKTKYLPDLLTIPLVWAGLVIQLFPESRTVGPEMAIAGAASGYCVLWLLAKTYQLLRQREGVGFGDLKLLAAIGAWLGPAPLPWIMFLASLMVVAFHALRFLFKHRGMMKQEFAFGPWIVAGTFVFYYAAFLR